MEELLLIKNNLLNETINYKEALELIYKLPKAWHTKHWKELRKEFLKERCEDCGTTEPPLIIQHTKQPKKFSEFYKEIMDKHVDYDKIKADVIRRFINDENIENYLKDNSVVRGSCTECGTINIRRNNKRNVFICVKQHVFETPVDVIYYPNSRTVDVDQAKQSAVNKVLYQHLSPTIEELRNKFDLQVGKEALLLSIEESIEYRLFKNVKTSCKRCAAVEDKIVPAYTLCKSCKTNYHNPIYESCFHCWGGSLSE